MFLVILYHVFYLWNKKYVFLYMENIHSIDELIQNSPLKKV